MPEIPELRARLLSIDEVDDAAIEWLSTAVEAHGWPGLRLVGADGTDVAWRIAREAAGAGNLPEGWLSSLREAVASGDADPRHYATLADASAAAAGEPQPFGTLAILATDGETDFTVPLADPAGVDDRRAEFGLPSIAADAEHLADGLVPYGPERGSNPVNQWPMMVEGHVSVEAVLEAGVRHVHRVWAVRPGDRRLGRLRALARERNVLIEQVAAGTIDELASGRTHGGVIGLVGSRRAVTIGSLLAEVGESAAVVMLDGIEDPFNFGQAVRALYAAGIDGLVIRRSWETALTTVTRASAGASELLPTAVVTSVEEAAIAARRAGMRVASAVDDSAAVDVQDADLRGPLLLLIGGERRGVTRSFADGADLLVRIGYGRQRAPALTAAAAAAIIGFEILRQRRTG